MRCRGRRGKNWGPRERDKDADADDECTSNRDGFEDADPIVEDRLKLEILEIVYAFPLLGFDSLALSEAPPQV